MDMEKWYLNTDPQRGGWLYEVVDSRDPDRVRYAGKTQVSIKERQAGHWYDARRIPKRTNSRMVNWLLKRNETPEYVKFNEAGFYHTKDELDQAERDLIAKRRSEGMCDLNIGDGGEGKAGVKWTPELREKMKTAQRRGESHHNATLTWATVNAVRESALERYTPRRELAERFGMGLSNMDKVLRNRVWVDPSYDPRLRKLPERRPETRLGNAVASWEVVREIRALRAEKWLPHREVAAQYGLKKSAVGYILSNETWTDPRFDPSTIKKRGAK